MKLLLDTCAFLWILWDSEELSETARSAFQDPANEVYLSAISSWEIALKYDLGKLPLPAVPERLIPRQRDRHGILPLPLNERAALHLRRLPPLHRDPFDRMLICQALIGGMTLLTPDHEIVQYPVSTLW